METSGRGRELRAGQLLIEWLKLLGWQVRVTRGAQFEGTAEHVRPDGRTVRVQGAGPTYGEMSWRLFERGIEAIEAGETAAPAPSLRVVA